MKLLHQILFWVLVPVLLMMGIGFVQIEAILNEVDQSINQRISDVPERINHAFDSELQELEAISGILSSAIEIVDALESGDADIAYKWANHFVDFKSDRVVFVDDEGVVIARGHNEFVFGDDLSGFDLIHEALHKDGFAGFAKSIEHTGSCLMSVMPILKHGDIIVGAAIVERDLTPEFLAKISDSRKLYLSLFDQEIQIASSLPGDSDVSGMDEIGFPLSIPRHRGGSTLQAKVMIDNSGERQNFLELRNQMLVLTVLFILFLIPLMAFFVRRLLFPVNEIVESLMRFSEHRDSIGDLIKRIQGIRITSKELGNINHSLVGMMETLEDAQKQLVESEKMSSLGGLVAGMAHELNTPIGICVTGSSSLREKLNDLRDKLKEGKIKRSELEDMLEYADDTGVLLEHNLERVSHLVQSFKEVSADQSHGEIRAFNLAQYLDEILISLRPEIRKKQIETVVECPETVEMTSYPGSLSQILTNFVMNSMIHGFEGRSKGKINIDARLVDHERVELVYQDDGKGMPARVLENVFEPFFTTKRGRGGTGLGMHIVYNLITQKLQGSVEADSQEDQGVRFTLTLPLVVEEDEKRS